jgi:hypothetical protein
MSARWPHSSSKRPLLRLFLFAPAICATLAAQEASPPRNPLSSGLPEWLELRLEMRLRTENHRDEILASEPDDDFGLARTRISLAGRPAKLLRFYVEGQDSRIGWREPGSENSSTEDPVDLRRAWVEVGGIGGPARLRLGRQAILFGGERLFGERRWSNLSPTWDAARLTLQHGRDKVDVLSMSMTEPARGFDRPFPADGPGNVHGAYGSLRSLVTGTSIEPYVFYVARPRNGPDQDFGPDAGSWSGGLRIAGDAGRGLEYEAEWTAQRGRARETALRGAMGAAQVTYGAGSWPWQTRVLLEHEYASGDDDPADGRVTTYDSLFTARRLHLGLVNFIGRRNIRAWQTGVETHPRANVRLRFDAHGFWVASRRDALYSPDGTPAVAPPPGGAQSAKAGEEIDFTFLWTPNERWEIDAGAMRFFSGPFVREGRGEPVEGVLLYVAMTLRL